MPALPVLIGPRASYTYAGVVSGAFHISKKCGFRMGSSENGVVFIYNIFKLDQHEAQA